MAKYKLLLLKEENNKIQLGVAKPNRYNGNEKDPITFWELAFNKKEIKHLRGMGAIIDFNLDSSKKSHTRESFNCRIFTHTYESAEIIWSDYIEPLLLMDELDNANKINKT